MAEPDLEARLARLSDWAAIADENDRIRATAGTPVHEQLRERRHECRLSQRALAELGYPEVQLDTVVKLADGLGCDLVLLPREES